MPAMTSGSETAVLWHRISHLGCHQNVLWKFTWDEMVKYDIESSIDYVLQNTGEAALDYVGHSQGTLIMFSKLAVEPKFASKIKQFHALAPVGTVKNVTGFLRYISDNLDLETDVLLEIFGRNQFTPETGMLHAVQEKYCYDVFIHFDCEDILLVLCGPNSHQQNVKKPPIYDITKIEAPMYLYWSPSDWLADEWDIQNHLLPNHPAQYLKNVMKVGDFNHLDFIFGEWAAAEIYAPMIEFMKAGN